MGLDIVIPIIIEVLPVIFEWAVKEGVKLIVRKIVDGAGRVATQIFYRYDSDGDGELDGEEVIYTLDTMVPDLSDGFCLVNKDDEIGLGMPKLKLLENFDITEFVDSDFITGNDNGFIIDIDSDGEFDDVIIPMPDFTGDGISDWIQLVDDDDNGLPDASPHTPFYPVGSDEYNYFIEKYSDSEVSGLDKPFDNYTVSEILLFFIASAAVVYLFSKIFRRRKL